MTLRESRGVFRLGEPVRPEWRESPLPPSLEVIDLEFGSGEDLWALAHGKGRRNRTRTFLSRVRLTLWRRTPAAPSPPAKPHPNMVPIIGYGSQRRHEVASLVLLRRPDTGWTTEACFAERVNSLTLLHDGTLAAGGDGMLALRSAGGDWVVREAPARLISVWGTGSACVYGLGETVHGKGPFGETGVDATWVSRGLFYFDGASWTEIDLAARNMPGFFADGACDRDGFGWIVGTHATHSCMARGKGTEWEPDGCSSWYLDHVHVDREGNAFALGGDGLWRHHTDHNWVPVEAFGHDIGQPLALGAVRGKPWAIDARSPFDRTDRRASTVGLFIGGLWVTLVPPQGSISHRGLGVFAISETGEVVIGSGGGVWQSPSLEGVVPGEWPPKRIMPVEDPQLGSSEPLVRAWAELQASRQLGKWCWDGDGIIGALGRRRRSILVRWDRLSEPPQTIAELAFDPADVSVAPRGRRVGVIPTELDLTRGVYEGVRRVVLIDLASGDAREMPLPAEFEFEEFADLMWSPDGSRFLIASRIPRIGRKGRTLLVFRADGLALEREFPVPEQAHPTRWDAEGIVLHRESLHARPFAGVPAVWLDPATGELRLGEHRQDVSPSGKYRVALRGTTIEVTTIGDETVRNLVPTPGGLLDTVDRHGAPRISGARWVGDRLELSARLLGPVHLDLETLTLRYALPPRTEGEPDPAWSPDGRFVLRRPTATGLQGERQGALWAWGIVE